MVVLSHRRRSRECLLPCFQFTWVRGVGVRQEEVTELRFLERHVDFLRDAFPPMACILKQYHDCPEEVPLLIEYFCIPVPLLKAWKVTEVQMREICHCTVVMAHCLFLVWPTPEDMFAYWHISDAEVSREAADAFNRFRFVDGMGLGPGAMVTVRQWNLWATTFYLQQSCPAGTLPRLYTKFLST